MDSILEKQVKQEILDNPYLFNYLGNLGQAGVVFEKAVARHKMICDALIFSHNQGIIGVEIKTQHDSLKRLSHQLDEYLKVCNYVTVFIHESWVSKVQQLLVTKKIDKVVGILVYSEYHHQVVSGVYRPMVQNPYFKIGVSLDMLWKTDIQSLLTTQVTQRMYHQAKTQGKVLTPNQQRDMYGITKGVTLPRLSKANLIKQYVQLVGSWSAIQGACDMIVTHQYDPDKDLTVYPYGKEIKL